jgi:hypothetical protein
MFFKLLSFLRGLGIYKALSNIHFAVSHNQVLLSHFKDLGEASHQIMNLSLLTPNPIFFNTFLCPWPVFYKIRSLKLLVWAGFKTSSF